MPFLPRFLPNTLHNCCCEQMRQAVRSRSTSSVCWPSVGGATLLVLWPRTGRTHQLRLHASRAGHAGTAAMAQTGDELLAQLSARLRVDGRVDGLVRDVAVGVVGEHALERSGNLLRRPLPVQHRAHHAPAHAVEGKLGGR